MFLRSFNHNLLLKTFNLLALIYFIFLQYYIYNLQTIISEINKIFLILLSITNIILFLAVTIFINKFNFKYKKNILKVLLVLSFTLLYAETYLEVERNIKKLSNSFYNNLKQYVEPVENYNSVISKLRLKNIEAYPEIASYRLLVEEKKTNKEFSLFPLGGIANKTAVFSNTSGIYTHLEMDEHGFNNKKNLYQKNKIDVVLVGACMWEQAGLRNPYEENIGQLLRNKNLWTLNLSKAGNNPLTQYAIIKEYGEKLKPRVVIFVVDRDTSSFSLNDQNSLGYNNKFLKKYLKDKNFSQNLINKQKNIDSFWINFFDNYINIEKEIGNKKYFDLEKFFKKINNILKFSKIREKLNMNPLKFLNKFKHDDSFDFLEMIIVKSKKLTDSWGGKFYIVYQPHKNHFDPSQRKPYMDFTIKLSQKNNIPLINLYTDVILDHPDQLSLLPMRKDPHFNAYANQLFADIIFKKLINDKIFNF